MKHLYCNWPEILAAGPGAVGGKAATLARLASLAFPIPGGIVIPTAAADAWLTTCGFREELLTAATDANLDRLDELQARLQSHPADPALLDALAQTLNDPAWHQRPLAVRSSSPDEDSANASFAGIHRSFLNVSGRQALTQAIVSVWASLWTPGAVCYRQRLGLKHADAHMAVLLMPLIAARASGIGFTCDPLNGRDDRVVIHANWGLGESLVNGQTAGDEITLGDPPPNCDLQLITYQVASKSLSSQPCLAGGTELVPSPGDKAEARVLSPEQALHLGRLLKLAATALDFSRPAWDGEWAWDGKHFWLLQLRPVTAPGRCTYPGLAHQPDIWSRGNTCEVLPEPLSPMDWCISRKLVDLLIASGPQLAGFPLHPGVQRAGLFHGRLYLNLSLIQWEAHQAFALEPQAMNRLVGGHQPEIQVPAATLATRLRRFGWLARYLLRSRRIRRQGEQQIEASRQMNSHWRQQPYPADSAGLARRMREVINQGALVHGLHFMQGAGGASLNMLVDLIEAQLPGEGHALASALLAGGLPSVTARQSYELIAIAQAAMTEPATRAWLEKRRHHDGDWRELPENNSFRRAFGDFIERYGHRGIYETYLRNPRWRECSDYLLDLLPDLAATDIDALTRRQHESAVHARVRLKAALPAWKRALLNPLIAKASAETNGREAARSAMIQFAETSRLGLLHIGRVWKEKQWLARPEDIFFLLHTEVLAVLDGLRPGAALAPLVGERQEQFKRWQDESAPDVIVTGEKSMPKSQSTATNGKSTPGTKFSGTAVGSGLACGPARLIKSPAESKQLQRGDILVVASTDPAWTPLFLKAAGLVMETGGFLSHGAIVAREFGIPAVVNLPGILQQIGNSDWLEVDGGQGSVCLVRQSDTRQRNSSIFSPRLERTEEPD